MVCRCDLQADASAMVTVIIFKYRPRRWLVAKGMIAEPPEEIDEDEVQIDTRRTERAAAMKRARDQAEEARRNVQVGELLCLNDCTNLMIRTYVDKARDLSQDRNNSRRRRRQKRRGTRLDTR